jgi:hypothetical protein
MFENLGNFLFKVSMIIFFVLGISLFLFSQREIITLIDLGEERYLQRNNVIVNKMSDEEYYHLGYEIVAQKMSFNQLPIIVEGVRLENMEDLLMIKTEGRYLKETVLDGNGNLIYIKYEEE